MPTEKARVVARKKVKLPSGDEINVPVVKQITFLDEVNRSQETRVTYDNSDINTKRLVYVVKVPSEDAGIPPTDDEIIKTEYIAKYTMKDEVNRSQETIWGPDNTDALPPGIPPPLKHFSVQYVRYFLDNDTKSTLYVDMQQLLEYHDKDEVNRSQQTHYKITGWDTVGSSDPKKPADGFCDPSLPLLDYTTTNVIDPPWRFDPLQVLVSFSDLPPGNIMVVGSQYLSSFVLAGIKLDRKTGAVLSTYDSSEYLVWYPLGDEQYPAGTNFGAAIDPKGNVVIGSYSFGRNTDNPPPDNTRGRNSSLQYYAKDSSSSPTWVGPLVGQSIVFDGAVGFDTKGNSYVAAGLGSNFTGEARTDAVINLTKFAPSGAVIWSTHLVSGGGLDAQAGTYPLNVLLDNTVIIAYGTSGATANYSLSGFDGKTGARKWNIGGSYYPATNAGFRSKALLLSFEDFAHVSRIDTNGVIDLTLSGPWETAVSADIGQDGKMYVVGSSDFFSGTFTIYQFSKIGKLLKSVDLGLTDGFGIIPIVSPGKDIVAVSYSHKTFEEQIGSINGDLTEFDIFVVYGFETTNLTQVWETTYSAVAVLDQGGGDSTKIVGYVNTLGRGP